MAVIKRWHVSVSTTDSSKPINITLSHRLGLSILIFTSFLLLFFLISIIFITLNHNKIIVAEQIIVENKLLKNKIDYLTTEIDSILTKLKLMEEWEDEIRSEENFKSINKEIRELGFGGLPQVDTTFAFVNDILNLEYNLTLGKLTRLNNKVDFDFDSHRELLDNVKLKELLYRSTPSIYPTYGRISDGFGWRTHPITKKKSFHYGLDFGNKQGTPVYATADGVIKYAESKKNLGKYISIQHKFGYQTVYAHLYKYLVKVGDEVKRGQIIALLGNTGRSTGAHLHYEILRYNKHRNPYDYLNKLEDDIILSQN